MLDINALCRLMAIPSEMQVVKMLNDRKCVLNEAPMVHDIRSEFQKNHIDIVAYLPESKPGVLHEFKIDVKSHDGQYENLFLETGTRANIITQARYLSWAFCAYTDDDITKKNRYLADVLDEYNGISFHKIINDQKLIDENQSEEENEERIVNYFSSHMELLDHDIIIYSYIDINDYLRKTGGNDLEERRRKWDKISPKTDAQYITCGWEYWDRQYGRAIYSLDKETKKWTVTPKGEMPHGVDGLPYWKSIDWFDGRELSEIDNEYGMQGFIALWKDSQKEGLTAKRFKRILGLSREE